MINVQEDISMKIEDKEKYSLIQHLSKQNVDAFNLSSEFYQDICFYFESPVKKDIAIKDRVKLFFPNITLCENGCNIKGINTTTMKADCECKLDNLINNNALSDNAFYRSQVGEIEELMNQINLEILKCSNKMFKHRVLSSYKGSLIILVFICIQIILTLIYCIADRNLLKNYLINILNSFLIHIHKENNVPPKKKAVKFTPNKDNNEYNHVLRKNKKLNTEVQNVKIHKRKKIKTNSLNRSHSSKNQLKEDKKFITRM